MMNEMKPLQPLSYGNILLVGVKASNFDDELRTHPRIIMWSSQEEHWYNKEIPQNVRAIFVTRFIGHAPFANIMKEARKKQITIFNPTGTGIITRQVKELLSLAKPITEPVIQPTIEPTKEPMTTQSVPVVPTPYQYRGKLGALIPFVDFDKRNLDNVEFLMKKVEELGIKTTHASITQFVVHLRAKAGRQTRPIGPRTSFPTRKFTPKVTPSEDVSVQILDEMIKSLQDMRTFIIETVEENKTLRNKINSFKKMIAE